MRHIIGTSSAAAASTLCVLAFMGLGAPAGPLAVSARGGVQAAAAASPLRADAPCAGVAWPYPPGACEIVDAGRAPPRRQVRLIAVDSEFHPR